MILSNLSLSSLMSSLMSSMSLYRSFVVKKTNNTKPTNSAIITITASTVQSPFSVCLNCSMFIVTSAMGT